MKNAARSERQLKKCDKLIVFQYHQPNSFHERKQPGKDEARQLDLRSTAQALSSSLSFQKCFVFALLRPAREPMGSSLLNQSLVTYSTSQQLPHPPFTSSCLPCDHRFFILFSYFYFRRNDRFNLSLIYYRNEGTGL